MSKPRGPIKGSAAARRCGPRGIAAQERASASRAAAAGAKDSPSLPGEPPAWLDPEAAEVWRKNLPATLERLTNADSELYALWCHSVAAAKRHSAARSRTGAAEHRAALRLALALGKELGLTPAARARIPTHEVDEDDADEAVLAAMLR